MDKLFAFDINETITEGDSYHKSNQSPISLTDPAKEAFQKLNTQNKKIVFYFVYLFSPYRKNTKRYLS